jgi:diketogulonate reductase-like aldo/keto reductase
MEECLRLGLTKSIGVSNYGIDHLEAMFEYATILPSVNQIEVHPWLQRKELRKVNEEFGVTTMGYSPLARGHKVDDPLLASIAQSIGCTPAQAAIKWVYDTGCITIPKSSNPNRIIENKASLKIDITDFIDDFSSLEDMYQDGTPQLNHE